jgi:predicted nucleic acid-binding protein
MSLTAYIDTNVLLRCVLDDSPTWSPRAHALVESAECLYLEPAMLIEAAHVMQSFYGFSRAATAEHLRAMLALPSLAGPLNTMADAVRLFAEQPIDIEDAWLAVTALASDAPRVASFDRDFDRIAGLERVSS